MKNNSSKGFTLVELMVVIGIISILSVIGLTAYGVARGKANDGRRKAEIKSITDSIESSKDFTNRVYRYTIATAATDFPSNGGVIPNDPSGTRNYCISTSTAVPISVPTDCTAATNLWPSGGCPTDLNCGGSHYDKVSSAISSTGDLGNTTPVNVKSWTLCAALDQESPPFCLSSLER
ncbi:MAG: prepilin-type N-terminal cleavage/methylation domain-containing protein [bacterium]|nr:prepilin-type N-terminal cleavage/methylation domain-containing protein [bacterium]